jgi:hypothetical protein
VEIHPLTDEEEDARQSALALAARLIGKSLPLGVPEVNALYQVIRNEHADFEEGVIATGIAFGELIVRKAGYEWVRVTDEWGSETSLSPKGWNGSCHPISMIQKRIERREDVDLGELCEDTIWTLQKRINAGKAAPRESKDSI